MPSRSIASAKIATNLIRVCTCWAIFMNAQSSIESVMILCIRFSPKVFPSQLAIVSEILIVARRQKAQ